MISNDMFYHINTTDPTNGQTVRQLWKINETIIRHPNIADVMPNYKSAIDSTDILKYMENYMFWEVDTQITAVMVDIDHTYDSCIAGNITDNTYLKGYFCDQIIATRKDPYSEFLCVYTTYKQMPGISATQSVYGLKIIHYNRMTNKIYYDTRHPFQQLMQICNKTYEVLLKEAQKLANLPKTTALLPISNSNGTDVEKGFERNVIIFEKSATENFLVHLDTSHLQTGVAVVLKEYIHHMIRLHEMDRLIALPIIADINATIYQAKLQLKQIFRCFEEAVLLDPHVFCSKKQKYDSVFTLGVDSYIKKDGNFWRMNSMGFTRQSNPNLTDDSLINLSFESHFTDLLERDGFDTYQPIHGFTYKPHYSDECFESDTTCNTFFQSSPFHYRLCVYGFKPSLHESGVHPHIKSYRYSTSSIHSKREKDLCSAVWLRVDTYPNKDYTVVSAVSNPSSGVNDVIIVTHSKTHSKWKLHRVVWAFDSTSSQISVNKTQDFIILWFKSLFNKNGNIYGYGKTNDGTLYDMSIKDNNYDFRLSSEELKDLFTCPHKHTYPALSNRRKGFQNNDSFLRSDTRERVVGYTVDYDFASKVRNGSETHEVSSIAITFGSVSAIVPSNQSITAIGASYWKSQSYMYWLTNPMHLRAFYYVSDTKWRFLFPFEHNFDINFWNESKATLNGKVVGFFTLESDKTPIIYALIEQSIYGQNTLRIYEITVYNKNIDRLNSRPFDHLRLSGSYISKLCHTSAASIESQGPTIYTFIFIILALILIIVSLIVAFLAYRFDQSKQTDNTDKTKAN
ncbi:unnamed protein product [Medioppia subpectinata]|uniref:Uncharacterized protein n=1 Tax=Medioppia subpectinata TaxID=1979941 RepID=A0A7R9KDP2_9ACAR|nr:unnamed protein product [Medioppia subpectinata]CAG2101360.1 unnamed protein product [Medioppia subpectinata]